MQPLLHGTNVREKGMSDLVYLNALMKLKVQNA